MPVQPIQHARPLRPDTARLGPAEARRQSVLLSSPGEAGRRYPGDSGRAMPAGGRPGAPRPAREEER